MINKNGEGRLLWTLNERPSENTWHEGQVEIRAHGEEELQVSGFVNVTYKEQLNRKTKARGKEDFINKNQS